MCFSMMNYIYIYGSFDHNPLIQLMLSFPEVQTTYTSIRTSHLFYSLITLNLFRSHRDIYKIETPRYI